MSRSDVVTNTFIFLLTCNWPKHSFLCQFGKLITLINNDRKAKLDSERTLCTDREGFNRRRN